LPGGAVVDKDYPEGPLFRGLIASAPQGPASQGPSPKVRYVFRIHGMGLTDRDDFHKPLYNLLADRYPGPEGHTWRPAMLPETWTVVPEGVDCSRPWQDHLHPGGGKVERPCEFPSFGVYRLDVFKKGGEEIRLYTYFWHRDLWRIQEPLLRRDMQRRHKRPAFLNSWLKHDIMDGGLSDAAAYAGPSGELVRAGIASVLCTMAIDASEGRPEPTKSTDLEACGQKTPLEPKEGVEFSFVTHSLGSRMLFDVLAPRDETSGLVRAPEAGTARALVLNRTRAVYMAANQLPLLALGSVPVSRPTGDKSAFLPPTDGCRSPISLIEAACRQEQERAQKGLLPTNDEPRLQVIGFYDPDDLLGFTASDTGRKEEFIDVRHRNAAQYLWVFTNPKSAHDQELQRRDTQLMILCGATVDARGRVKPATCP
jgi:hypothetical protein